MAETSTSYNSCAALEWKLGCHLAEWRAARELAYRLDKPVAELDRAHMAGVLRLLHEHITTLEASNAA